MRFAITGEWKTNQVLRLIIALFLLFVVLFWLTNLLLFFAHMSLDYDAIVAHYLGKRDAWGGPAVPRSYKVLLEVSHAHLFSMGILILTMAHLLLFIPAPVPTKVFLVVTTFAAALVNEGAGWLIRYVHPHFAYLKMGAFVLFQIFLGAICVMLFLALRGNWRNAYMDSDPRRKPCA